MIDNPARPKPGTRLCSLADMGDPGAKAFLFRAGDLIFTGLVVRRRERAFGFVDRCPHAGMPLAAFGDRFLTPDGDLIVCAAHGALFRPEDGACVAGPCEGRSLTPWPVSVRDGAVLAD